MRRAPAVPSYASSLCCELAFLCPGLEGPRVNEVGLAPRPDLLRTGTSQVSRKTRKPSRVRRLRDEDSGPLCPGSGGSPNGDMQHERAREQPHHILQGAFPRGSESLLRGEARERPPLPPVSARAWGMSPASPTFGQLPPAARLGAPIRRKQKPAAMRGRRASRLLLGLAGPE